MRLYEFSLFHRDQPIPKPTRPAKEFIDWADGLPMIAGYHEGQIPISKFLEFNIENWQRNPDPRMRDIERDIAKTGIHEPIMLTQMGEDRVIVQDGGHRVSSAVRAYLHNTKRDIVIPFYFRGKQTQLKEGLNNHVRVGLDLDGTLLNGPHHKDIEQWLKNTKSEVQVITFNKHLPRKVSDYLLEFPQITAIHTLPADIPEFSKDWLKWKGKVCKQNGIGALIDDDIASVVYGCHKYGITLIDANTFPTKVNTEQYINRLQQQTNMKRWSDFKNLMKFKKSKSK